MSDLNVANALAPASPAPLRPLTPDRAQPSDVLPRILASGSDNRIALDDIGRNGYGCRARPFPDALTFSSSTANTISGHAFAQVEAAYSALFVEAANSGFASAFEAATEKLRHDLLTLLELDSCGADIVFSPSGTDSGVHALQLMRCVLGGKLTSIVVAAEETGSGVPFAAGGRHFNGASSSGGKVAKGALIAGMEGVETVCVSAQDAQGMRPAAEIDREVHAAVAQAVKAGRRAALHVMHHSKTGTRAPGAALLTELRAAYGDDVQFVLDACQFRLSRKELRRYLDDGFLVLVTGSKFFAGPPLSGALIVPQAFHARLRMPVISPGLVDYSTFYDWPESLSAIRGQLSRRENLGQYLRWIAAHAEMRAYYAVPELYRRLALAEFSRAARVAIADRPGLALLPPPEWCAESTGDEFGVRSVFPFLVRLGSRYATPAESRVIYRALNDDVSALVRCKTVLHASLAATPCHIGQPVTIRCDGTEAGALRVSADARLVSECFAESDMRGTIAALRRKIAQLDVVLDKVALLVESLDVLMPVYAQN